MALLSFRGRRFAGVRLVALVMLAATAAGTTSANPYTGDLSEVLVFGSVAESRAWLESENWWGANEHETQLQAPRVLITGITERWRSESQQMTVAEKKEGFYRLMLPLVLYANELVVKRRDEMTAARERLVGGGNVSDDELARLRAGAVLLRVAKDDRVAALDAGSAEWVPLIDEMLYRLDIVPPGLALGQAAYESGYGTSRFAREGNSLFGQWTFHGEGLKPEQQRESLGDHRIAAFEWPFDSVRGYFINLSSHPAYEEFRRLRAELRAAGKPLDSLVLADGLIRYSERGQEYVDSLKGIIRVNRLDSADDAVLRDEPLRFYVGAESPEDAERVRQEIAELQKSGEWGEMVKRMRLD
jgi:Bax protein